MSINLKLIAGCLALMLVAVAVGFVSQGSQERLRDLAAGIHDGSLIPLRHLHLADSAASELRGHYLTLSARGEDGLTGVLDETEAAELVHTLRQILHNLRAAGSGGLSPEARRKAREVSSLLSRLVASGGHVSRRLVLRDIQAAARDMEEAAAILEHDALLLRSEVEDNIRDARWRSRILHACAVIAALLAALLLSATITGPIRRVIRTAKMLASGHLKDPIPATGRGEIGELFAALAKTQRDIIASEDEKNRLVAAQAHGYDATIALQHSRFEAALNNMTQGLCMFDKGGKLVVYNEPFAKVFGHHTFQTAASAVLADPRFHSVLSGAEDEAFSYEMPDGQIFAVKRRRMADRGFVLTFENITEQHRTALRLAHVAGHDGLTDLPNRRQFCERLEAILALDGRRGDVAVLYLDLYGFRAVNDGFGHAVGDELLVAVGAMLAECVGESGLVARFGGDEFAVVLSNVDGEGAAATAERIIRRLAEPIDVKGRRVAIGVSIGSHVVPARAPAAELDVETILKNCDLALHEAKAQKGSAHRPFVSGMRDRILARRSLEVDLSTALERGEFELFYQPFVDVEKGAVAGFEALLRWRHPTRGMVSPAEFIPLAEDLGLINDIGLWALGTASAVAAGWPRHLGISVNLSPVQLKSPKLLETVDRALRNSGLEPTRLQLEVTESVFLDRTDEILATLSALRRRGILVAMDDFGTGYSSLGYLSRFPFGKLKIDQSFVRDLGKPENIAIVRAVISLSKAMNMAVIAEGIETREQCEILYREGCREMQGYYFSPPRPAGDLAKVLVEIRAMGSQIPHDLRAAPEEPRASA